jgi:hypothetical protein
MKSSKFLFSQREIVWMSNFWTIVGTSLLLFCLASVKSEKATVELLDLNDYKNGGIYLISIPSGLAGLGLIFCGLKVAPRIKPDV